MTHFMRSQLEDLAAEQGHRNEQEHSQSRIVEERSPLPDFRVDIRREICETLIKADRPLTRAEIAKAVDRRKSTWLNERIEALVSNGLLSREQAFWKNGVVIYYYRPAEDEQ